MLKRGARGRGFLGCRGFATERLCHVLLTTPELSCVLSEAFAGRSFAQSGFLLWAHRFILAIEWFTGKGTLQYASLSFSPQFNEFNPGTHWEQELGL